MDLGTESVLFKLIAHKRKEINNRYRETNRNEISAWSSIYLMFAETDTLDLPNSLYVGKTKRSLKQRYSQHISEIKRRLEGKVSWNSKYAWMNRIIHSGADLRMIELNRVPSIMEYKIENEWIEFFNNNNFKMMNKNNDKMYKNKILIVW